LSWYSPPRLVDVETGPEDDLHPVLKLKAKRPHVCPENNSPYLTRLVFQGEIYVAGAGPAQVGDLSLNPKDLKI